MKDENKYRHLRAAAWLTQFGLNMVSPIILCILIGIWVKNTFDTPSWVVMAALALGICAAVCNMINFARIVKKEMGGKDDDKKSED